MSNYLAIATVTAVLQRTLQASVQADVDGARVTTVRPDNVGSGTPETGINLFLYRVTPNPTWRNADLRTRSPDGQFIKRPQAALDLFYLLSCYGNEVELEPQRLMGSAIRTLHAKPVLDQASIQDAIVSANFRFLRDSNLGDQVETVKLMPLPLSTDELSNLWSVFFQTPYALSIAYQAGVVLIESDDIPRRALPVRDRYFDIIPNQPLIERLTTTKGDLQPIATDTTLVIRGQRLRYEVTEVRINRVDFVPQKVSDTEIILPLSDLPTTALQAGVQSLQVIHRQSTDAFRGIESNAVPFILRPTITEVTVSNIESESDTLRQAEVTLTLNPPIVKGQRCLLALNERTPSNPTAYTFDAIKRETDGTTLTVPIRDVKPGEYLVRIQVDGAESRLQVDSDRNSPTFEQFIAPTIIIP
jgi:hypothetical protein